MPRPTNKHERKVWDEFFDKGWMVYRNGWPDILAEHNGTLIAIEVKATQKQPLSSEQLETSSLLSKHGFKCYKWSPDGGFQKIFDGFALPNVNSR